MLAILEIILAVILQITMLETLEMKVILILEKDNVSKSRKLKCYCY